MTSKAIIVLIYVKNYEYYWLISFTRLLELIILKKLAAPPKDINDCIAIIITLITNNNFLIFFNLK